MGAEWREGGNVTVGVSFTVDDKPFEVESYTVQSDATPLFADDSTGSVGGFTVSCVHVPNLFDVYRRPCRLVDTDRGLVTGTVAGISRNDATGLWQLDCVSRLGDLNLYNVQAPPIVGTVFTAIRDYFELAGVTSGWVVEDDVKDIPVLAPGWFGELWANLKSFAAAYNIEIALTSGIIRVRKPRQMVAMPGYGLDRTVDFSTRKLARSVEVYCYNSFEIKNELVYPPNGWVTTTDVISFPAGKRSEITLPLSASVSSITQPEHVTSMDKLDSSRSAYTVVTSKGRVLSKSEFEAHGGYVFVELGKDYRSIELTVRGPDRVFDENGRAETTFYFALGSASEPETSSEAQYPTLRILGYGVDTMVQKMTFPTGVPETLSNDEVGITVDSLFINSPDRASKIGQALAHAYSTVNMELTGSVAYSLPTNERGFSAKLTYMDVQGRYTGTSYGDVDAEQGQYTYQTHEDRLWDTVFAQGGYHTMGNTIGSRVFDEASGHWFRIRESTVRRDVISFRGELDTINSDVYSAEVIAKTYADMQRENQELTYQQFIGKGVYL